MIGTTVGVIETLAEQDDRTAAAAAVYLKFGAAPLSELVRVLADHLEIETPGVVRAAVRRLAGAGRLHLAENIVSLPAGAGIRDTEEN